MNLPYDDRFMTYDYNNHLYVLTAAGVLEDLGINLDIELVTENDANPSRLVERFLLKVSKSVYNYYYQHSANNEWQEWQLAKNPSLREGIKATLGEQLLYVLANGFIALYSGVNIAKGTAMDLRSLRRSAKVAEEVIIFGEKNIPDRGVCLLYLGLLPMPKAYREGY